MSHFYKYNSGKPEFLSHLATPAQAKKVKGAWPSVTTVLGVISDPFLDKIYKPRKITELARENESMHWKDILDLTYGVREHPETAEEMPSSEFGTAVHKRIEDYVLEDIEDKLIEAVTPWDDYAMPFIDWYKENQIQPVAVEHMLGEPTIKIVGSVDFIGKDGDTGDAFLADYKCRSNCKGRGKFYDKDLYQLAIEAWMLSKRARLEYIPGCISICIDCETKKHYHKVWDPDKIMHGIEVAKLCSKLYWKTRMK